MDRAPLKVVGSDLHVPLISGEQVPSCYLDTAATTPPLTAVWQRVQNTVGLYGSVHRGSGYQSRVSTKLVDEAREVVEAFVSTGDSKKFAVFTQNSTHGFNLLAQQCAQRFGRFTVVHSAHEHTSNVLPWRRWAHTIECPVDGTGSMDLDHLEAILKTSGAQIVTCAAACNVTGRVADLSSIAEISRRYDAYVVADASQFSGHRSLRRGVGEHEPWDFVVFSGHKMYAPFGIGVLAGPREFFDRGWPSQPGGGAVKIYSSENVVWNDLPARESGGTVNFFGLIALAQACIEFDNVGFDVIETHESALSRIGTDELATIPGVTVLRPDTSLHENWLPIFPFVVDGYHHSLVAAYLGAEHGISVRAGHMCQFALVANVLGEKSSSIDRMVDEAFSRDGHLDLFGVVRASAGGSNRPEDFSRLSAALRQLILEGPNFDYEMNREGEYVPCFEQGAERRELVSFRDTSSSM